jgi:hypothetical protein
MHWRNMQKVIELIAEIDTKIKSAMVVFQQYWKMMDYDKGSKIVTILTFLKQTEHAYIIREHELKKMVKDYSL